MHDQQILELARQAGCTPRQLQALELTAAGYGRKRAGRIMGISPTRVGQLLEAARLRIRKEHAA